MSDWLSNLLLILLLGPMAIVLAVMTVAFVLGVCWGIPLTIVLSIIEEAKAKR